MAYWPKAAVLTGILASSACLTSDAPPVARFEQWLPGGGGMQTAPMRAHAVRYRKGSHAMDYVIAEDSYNGENTWRVEIAFAGSDQPDRIWLDAATLAFRGRDLQTAKYRIQVTMADGLFSGRLEPAADSDYTPVEYQQPYPHDAFEPAIINYAIAALPLAAGYTVSIPVFDLNKGSQMLWSNIEVVGEETVDIDGIRFDTWKVRSHGIKDKTIWISKDHPYAVRMQTAGNFGSWTIDPASIELH